MRKPKFKMIFLIAPVLVAQEGFENTDPDYGYYNEYYDAGNNSEKPIELSASDTSFLSDTEDQYATYDGYDATAELIEENDNGSDLGIASDPDYDYSNSEYESVQESQDYNADTEGGAAPSSTEENTDSDGTNDNKVSEEAPVQDKQSFNDLGLPEQDYNYEDSTGEANTESKPAQLAPERQDPVTNAEKEETEKSESPEQEVTKPESASRPQTPEKVEQKQEDSIGISDTAYDYYDDSKKAPAKVEEQKTAVTDSEETTSQSDGTSISDSEYDYSESVLEPSEGSAEPETAHHQGHSDIMSCQTNQHVIDMITSYLTGGQDYQTHDPKMSYAAYIKKFGDEGHNTDLLPEIVQHKGHDKTALMEFNFLQLLQNYLLTEKADDALAYPPQDAPKPFAKVMCLLMAEDLSNREYLGDSRTINCPAGVCQTTWFLTPIWGFGCWCNFGAALMTGSGLPVHRADEICRDMQLCMRCAKRDAQKRGEFCDPITQIYSYTSTGGTFVSDCTTPNGSDLCAIDTCCCEQTFLADLLAEVFNPAWAYDAQFKHDHGFDPVARCPQPLGDRAEADCCGIKPRRFPYNSAKRDCCKETNIFNPVREVCCPDGSIADDITLC